MVYIGNCRDMQRTNGRGLRHGCVWLDWEHTRARFDEVPTGVEVDRGGWRMTNGMSLCCVEVEYQIGKCFVRRR